MANLYFPILCFSLIFIGICDLHDLDAHSKNADHSHLCLLVLYKFYPYLPVSLHKQCIQHADSLPWCLLISQGSQCSTWTVYLSSLASPFTSPDHPLFLWWSFIPVLWNSSLIIYYCWFTSTTFFFITLCVIFLSS